MLETIKNLFSSCPCVTHCTVGIDFWNKHKTRIILTGVAVLGIFMLLGVISSLIRKK